MPAILEEEVMSGRRCARRMLLEVGKQVGAVARYTTPPLHWSGWHWSRWQLESSRAARGSTTAAVGRLTLENFCVGVLWAQQHSYCGLGPATVRPPKFGRSDISVANIVRKSTKSP
ncbi:MAG: hypothetical protein ACI8PT_004463 [Gammaproteobacteria bacterium]|jgi:hypothetical protein